jgi:hypothetical protein
MATRKTPKASKQKPAIEVIVEIPRGTKRAKMDRLIHDALRQVPTDVFEAGETIVVRSQTKGAKPPPTEPPENKV